MYKQPLTVFSFLCCPYSCSDVYIFNKYNNDTKTLVAVPTPFRRASDAIDEVFQKSL